jgi:hypothetical protein
VTSAARVNHTDLASERPAGGTDGGERSQRLQRRDPPARAAHPWGGTPNHANRVTAPYSDSNSARVFKFRGRGVPVGLGLAGGR